MIVHFMGTLLLVPLYIPPQSIAERIQHRFPFEREVALQVAQCESRLDPKARNKTSTAKGLFQILDGTWVSYGCTGDVLNADDNIRCARKIYERSGWRPWNASKHCWRR